MAFRLNLVSQARQRIRQAAPPPPAPRQARAARDDVHRVPRLILGRKASLRGRVSGQAFQGDRIAVGQLGAPAHLLRLSRRALEACPMAPPDVRVAYAALRRCAFAVAAFLIKPVVLDTSAALSKPNTAEYLLPIVRAITKLRLIPASPIDFAIW